MLVSLLLQSTKFLKHLSLELTTKEIVYPTALAPSRDCIFYRTVLL